MDEPVSASPAVPGAWEPQPAVADHLSGDSFFIPPQVLELIERSGSAMPMDEFQDWARFIFDNFGITVGKNKRILVSGRVRPMLEKYGFADYRACLEAIRSDAGGGLLSELANRISTNHTSFYREEEHFRLLREKILPDLAERKRQAGELDLRIWCAACATGEEAYTLLFCLYKFFGSEYGDWRSGVLATDISAAALREAALGRYELRRLHAVPGGDLGLFFNRLDDDHYEVRQEFRREVVFRRLNLMNDVYPFRQPFDIIFCRNVMIYFRGDTREKLLARLRNWLSPGGHLFIGHSESLLGEHSGYEHMAPAVYRRLP